jgi:predicted metal-dependent phosphoesterase TrpH
MLVDLHAHSSVSDGTDSPRRLVERAAAAGVDVLGLADHDTTDGWHPAVVAGDAVGVQVVPAIEVSTSWRGADVHLLAYWPAEDHAGLQRMLAAVRRARETRLPRMLEHLAQHGVHLTEREVRDAAGPAVSLGRPHVADALVAAGVVTSREQAFDTWIGEGKPGHVSKQSPDLREAIRTVIDAGGVPVLAHPWGRGSRAVLDPAALEDLSVAGLVGLEVEHVDHDDADRDELSRLARCLDLVVTGGSDYHGNGKAGVELGMCRTSPAAYEALMSYRGQGS